MSRYRHYRNTSSRFNNSPSCAREELVPLDSMARLVPKATGKKFDPSTRRSRLNSNEACLNDLTVWYGQLDATWCLGVSPAGRVTIETSRRFEVYRA